jgi:membrane complex biogenesis BtpA family protein
MSELLSMIRAGGKPVIGMIQLDPLPGGSRYTSGGIDRILNNAFKEAETLAANGVDVLMVQNLGDLPVAAAVAAPQIAWMTRVVAEVRARFGRPVGINLLENDAEAMLAVASAAGADFVRIKVYVGAMLTPFGIESGQAYAAIRARNACDAKDVAIFADVHDRTGVPLATGGFAEDLDHAMRLGGADGLVLTGKSYGATLELITLARKLHVEVPILAGGGINVANVSEITCVADGVIVSSALKDSGGSFGRFVPAKVSAFMEEARRARASR